MAPTPGFLPRKSWTEEPVGLQSRESQRVGPTEHAHTRGPKLTHLELPEIDWKAAHSRVLRLEEGQSFSVEDNFALQYWVSFCHTATWISHRYIHVPSVLNLPPQGQACSTVICQSPSLTGVIPLSPSEETQIPSPRGLHAAFPCLLVSAAAR